MTAFPENPFFPGAGTMPTSMGRRPEVEGVLSGILRQLRPGRSDCHMAFLCGPPGNGKTVLLRWLRAVAAKDDAPDEERIVLVRLSRTHMKSPEAVAQTILNATSGSSGGAKLEAAVSVSGIGSVRVAGSGTSPSLSLAEVLAQKTDPMLVTLDEAHEASPEVLGDLLNVVQEAGEVRPVTAADRERQDYCSDRLDEFEEADLLPLARRGAAAFVASAEAPADRRLANAALDSVVAQEDGKDGKAFLTAKGYVWRDGSAGRSWTPGIPGLTDYALEEISAP